METQITRRQWPNEAARLAFESAPGVLSYQVGKQLETGHAQLYEIDGDGVSGFFVTRIEGDELVLCACIGRGLVAGLKAVKAGALGKFKSVRCHTSDWRIESLYPRVGLQYVESVYRMEL
ncbi:hypothetical protein [Streptomyces sp. B29(2018)]|uniref:hypothetical protein n=1 Tax=Streptomyces sp. B29(2018) TaxID=2485016 RepID=UPI000FD68A1E|nr:hypothetical protein [Streptomyces sp. B29(2018)]